MGDRRSTPKKWVIERSISGFNSGFNFEFRFWGLTLILFLGVDLHFFVNIFFKKFPKKNLFILSIFHFFVQILFFVKIKFFLKISFFLKIVFSAQNFIIVSKFLFFSQILFYRKIYFFNQNCLFFKYSCFKLKKKSCNKK